MKLDLVYIDLNESVPRVGKYTFQRRKRVKRHKKRGEAEEEENAFNIENSSGYARR